MFVQRLGELPFGTLQGIAPGGVKAYSNGSDRFFSGHRSTEAGVTLGFTWQCVEFARRYLLERKGLVLPDVALASMIFEMASVKNAESGEDVQNVPVKNGSETKPVADSLLIYASTEKYMPGHVAAIVEVSDEWVRIADQNHIFSNWPAEYYSMELKVAVTEGTDGKKRYEVQDPQGAHILGWVTWPATPNRDPSVPLCVDAKHFPPQDYGAMVLDRVEFQPKSVEGPWLDVTNKAEKKFVEEFGVDLNRSRLAESKSNYYRMNTETWLACVRAGTQLHSLAIAATRKVLDETDTELLSRFGIPSELWPRLRQSFARCPFQITGRFDFVVDADGTQLKMFEYNADSASTLLECGRIQAKWAEAVGLAGEGSRSAGFQMPALLEKAWNDMAHVVRLIPAGSTVHFCVDTDGEEEYTALYMMEFAALAGLKPELVVGLDKLRRDPATGRVFDAAGIRVQYCWKTWNWESVISDWRKGKERTRDTAEEATKVYLCDIFLPANEEHAKAAFDEMVVFEPMWKLIPGNKAILPVLWDMAPGHPNLLRTTWTLDEQHKKLGYCKKPIVGRIGSNITIVAPGGQETLAASSGNYGDREHVFQELFKLPKRDDYYGILGGWVVGGYFAGAGVREDHGIITGVESPFSAVRIQFDIPVKPVMQPKKE